MWLKKYMLMNLISNNSFVAIRRVNAPLATRQRCVINRAFLEI
jgi:hypothetical protein